MKRGRSGQAIQGDVESNIHDIVEIAQSVAKAYLLRSCVWTFSMRFLHEGFLKLDQPFVTALQPDSLGTIAMLIRGEQSSKSFKLSKKM